MSKYSYEKDKTAIDIKEEDPIWIYYYLYCPLVKESCVGKTCINDTGMWCFHFQRRTTISLFDAQKDILDISKLRKCE